MSVFYPPGMSMDRQKQFEVFQAQVKNLRALDQAWSHTKRSIHRELLSGQRAAVSVHTKLLALIYCAWAESAFLKLIHTPYGFELDEIRQIKMKYARDGITCAWQKAVELALRKVKSRNGSYVPNVRQSLNRLLETYILEPSQLRNKVAHGQWVVALNSRSTDTNAALTSSLATLDLVTISRLREGCIGLCEIVKLLVESPNRAFARDYWTTVSDIEAHLVASSSYTLEDKVKLLKAKKARHNLSRA